MITREQVSTIPAYVGLLHPTILNMPTGRWAVFPGMDWYAIAADVTQEDLESRWTRPELVRKTAMATESASKWQVEGSKGDKYTVSSNMGTWHCTCSGFGFRRRCKHIESIKAKQ